MGYSTYLDYVGIKVHFNVYEYCWNPQHPRTLPLSTFKKRRDCKLFGYMEKKFPDRDKRNELIISGMLFSKNAWIGDILNSEEINEYHDARIKRLSYLKSLFKMDCDTIDYHLYEKNETLTTLTFPSIILPLYRKKKIALETLAIFDYFTGWAVEWTPDNPFEIERRLQIAKYKHLLNINEAKIELPPLIKH